MASTTMNIYVPDEDYQIWVDHKEELRATARDAFRKRMDILRGGRKNGK